MIYLIFGLILLLFPFLLLNLFSDKKRGFIYILLFFILFHTAVAVLTQILHIFSYQVILFATLLADIVILYFVVKKRIWKKFKIDCLPVKAVLAEAGMILLVAGIAFLSLYQLHYKFTGEMSMVSDKALVYHEVKDMKYVYPYFSDEWYAVSLINGSIDSHSLPLTNTLTNTFFPNLEMFFHSFVAEIILLLGLTPLIHYSIIGIFINTLIIALCYLFLRINDISKLASAICALSVLYITSSANVPGIWHFIPVSLGIVVSLILFCFLSTNNFKMACLSFLLLCLFYPPLFPFLGLALLVYSFNKFKNIGKNNLKKIGVIVGSIVVVTTLVIVVFPDFAFVKFIKYGFSRLYFTSFTGLNFAQFRFYYMMPIFIIILAVIGLAPILKSKKWLFSQIILGVAMWAYYSFSVNRFVIDYERVVFYTSIMACLVAGFGLAWLEKKLHFVKYAQVGAIILFILFVPVYTQRESWKKIVLINSTTNQTLYVRSPINNYLTEDDIDIFTGITDKRFLSSAWKGLTIGTATNNYPLFAKEGTISVGTSKILSDFMNANCDDKMKLAQKNKIDYVYIDFSFACKGIEKIDQSQEGFILYKL